MNNLFNSSLNLIYSLRKTKKKNDKEKKIRLSGACVHLRSKRWGERRQILSDLSGCSILSCPLVEDPSAGNNLCINSNFIDICAQTL